MNFSLSLKDQKMKYHGFNISTMTCKVFFIIYSAEFHLRGIEKLRTNILIAGYTLPE